MAEEVRKRFTYSFTEECIMNPKFPFNNFAGGRLEVSDETSRNPYPVYEGRFLMPRDLFEQLREVFDGYESDEPMMFKVDTLNLSEEYRRYHERD